jgi:hypothetical protein
VRCDVRPVCGAIAIEYGCRHGQVRKCGAPSVKHRPFHHVLRIPPPQPFWRKKRWVGLDDLGCAGVGAVRRDIASSGGPISCNIIIICEATLVLCWAPQPRFTNRFLRWALCSAASTTQCSWPRMHSNYTMPWRSGSSSLQQEVILRYPGALICNDAPADISAGWDLRCTGSTDLLDR